MIVFVDMEFFLWDGLIGMFLIGWMSVLIDGDGMIVQMVSWFDLVYWVVMSGMVVFYVIGVGCIGGWGLYWMG